MSYSASLADLTDNLVPFEARQVASSLIWSAPDVDDEEALRRACSYLIDPEGSTPTCLFHAERYGGSGIQRNGGGARCGFNGRYQIKGIGANPLVGEGSDPIHSNGALTASDAIYEAFWGEALAKVLPYGAVRARAVLLTDSFIELAFKRAGGPLRRALLVREPVVRPAHFERAPYFRPQPCYATQLIHDAVRVKAAIQILPKTLPAPPGGFSAEASRDPRRYVIEGLCEMARRQAWQMAFCRTRFLRVTTSPSNVAMDGRLLDFNGLSSLFPGDFRDSFDYRFRLTELMNEPGLLQQSVADLCLYLGKYMFDAAFTQAARQQVEEVFMHTFHNACYRCYLDLLGFPAEMLASQALPQPLTRLVDSFMTLLSRRRATLYCSSDSMPSHSPLTRLAVVLIRQSQGETMAGSEDLMRDPHFIATQRLFTEASRWLVEQCRSQGREVAFTLAGMEQQARLKLQPRGSLGKARMFKDIAELLDTHAGDPPSLRKALFEMGERMQAFACDVLGRPQQSERGERK
ncbi:MchC protein [Pseudescherichia sp.]|uniref:MchC protein n=1 Tax=Pseudescherichia sp. TaxID=2055881 RepID=UPI0028A2B236|nr:MchC protein [Pseudescherichia sp.]